VGFAALPAGGREAAAAPAAQQAARRGGAARGNVVKVKMQPHGEGVPAAKRHRAAAAGCEAPADSIAVQHAQRQQVERRLRPGWVHSGAAAPRFNVVTWQVPVDPAVVASSAFWSGLAEGTGVHCCNESYWKAHSSPQSPFKHESPEAWLRRRQSELRTEGYTRLPGAAPSQEAGALAAAIATLVRGGWHPIWSLVFDEAWLWLGRVRGVLSAMAANPSAAPNFDFMAWYIDPTTSQSGWVPHRDRRNMPAPAPTDGGDDHAKGGAPQYCTVWLALTPATPLNGCMYILPADLDSAYAANEAFTSTHDDECAGTWVQDLRALPCEQGEALLWTGRALHFGGRSCPRADQPRISIACVI
jgi:hypothetical protein